MRQREFEFWLDRWDRTEAGGPLDPRSRGTTLSNCRRVERYEGDLDVHFAKDRGTRLLARLRCTAGTISNPTAAHRIPIKGNVYNVTASLRSAVVRYLRFCERWPVGAPTPRTEVEAARAREGNAPSPPSAGRRSRAPGKGTWDTWGLPSETELLELARVIARYAQFLAPEIVAAVVADNEVNRPAWEASLRRRGVEPTGYLWPRGPCLFPGVRRYTGRRELVQFHGDEAGTLTGALDLDSNTYPKHLWSFAIRGRPFQQFGPTGYALAHLYDHKAYRIRRDGTAESSAAAPQDGALPGLFTSAANTAYLPESLLRPSDTNEAIRGLLLGRARQLYGGVCEMLPPSLRFSPVASPGWDIGSFPWPAPVGEVGHVPMFLYYRAQEMARLLM